MVVKKIKKQKEPAKDPRTLFYQFFEVFEITRIDDSSILIFFKEPEPTSDSLKIQWDTQHLKSGSGGVMKISPISFTQGKRVDHGTWVLVTYRSQPVLCV